jgi:hypothetical protein
LGTSSSPAARRTSAFFLPGTNSMVPRGQRTIASRRNSDGSRPSSTSSAGASCVSQTIETKPSHFHCLTKLSHMTTLRDGLSTTTRSPVQARNLDEVPQETSNIGSFALVRKKSGRAGTTDWFSPTPQKARSPALLARSLASDRALRGMTNNSHHRRDSETEPTFRE